MSLFAILYSEANESPAESLHRAFPQQDVSATSFRDDQLAVTASRVAKPHFLDEEFGIDPKIQLYFTLEKSTSSEARRHLASALQRYLASFEGNTLVMYGDRPVVIRIGQLHEVAKEYRDFVPAGSQWNDVS